MIEWCGNPLFLGARPTVDWSYGILLIAQFPYSISTSFFVWPCKYPLGLFISPCILCAWGSPVNLPATTVSPTGDWLVGNKKNLLQSLEHSLDANIYIAGFCFSIFNTFSIHFKCFSKALTPIMGLFIASFLDWSSHALVMWARRWFFFFPALFGRPLAATIDLQVELMTKMTNPWGAQVREIMREMWRETASERETNSHNTCMSERTHIRTHTDCTVFPLCSHVAVRLGWSMCGEERCHIYAAQGRHRFWVWEFIVCCWHDAHSSDRFCHPDSAARPPNRQEMSAQGVEDPEPCWEHDPNLALTTAPITGADLIVSLLGMKKFIRIEWKGLAALRLHTISLLFILQLQNVSSEASPSFFFFPNSQGRVHPPVVAVCNLR